MPIFLYKSMNYGQDNMLLEILDLRKVKVELQNTIYEYSETHTHTKNEMADNNMDPEYKLLPKLVEYLGYMRK